MAIEQMNEKETIALIKKKDKSRKAFYEQRTLLIFGGNLHSTIYSLIVL